MHHQKNQSPPLPKKIFPSIGAGPRGPGLELGDDNLRHHFRSFGSMLHIGRNHLSSILGDLEISAGKTFWREISLPFYCVFFFLGGGGGGWSFGDVFSSMCFFFWGGWGVRGGEKEKRTKTQEICWRAEDGQKFDPMCFFFSHVFFVETYYLVYPQSNMEDELSPWKKHPCSLKKDIQITEFPFFSGSTVL